MLLSDINIQEGGVIAVLLAVVAYIFRLLIVAKDEKYTAAIAERDAVIREKERERMEMESIKKSFSEIAHEAVRAASDTVNKYLRKEGKATIKEVLPVISESHSPSTASQREEAEIATLRAQMVVIKEKAGLPPREEPPHAVENNLIIGITIEE